MTLPNDTMESLTDRALKEAREKGMPVRFEFDRKLFEALPSPEGYGSIQMIGEFRQSREATPDEMMILYIGTCSKEMPKKWRTRQICVQAMDPGTRHLVAGREVSWLRQLKEDVISELPREWIERVTINRIDLRNQSSILFVTYKYSEQIRGAKFHCSFIEDNQEGFMGGNYNEFPYRSTSRDRERFLERQEREDRRESRWAEFQKIEKDRMAALEARAAEEKAAEEAQSMAMKPRSLGYTQLARQMQEYKYPPIPAGFKVEEKFRILVEQQALENLKRISPMMMMSTWDTNVNSSYGGITRNPTAEERLAVVRNVLLEHLRFQMQQAPSMSAVYANDVRAITAADIARVVQALEPTGELSLEKIRDAYTSASFMGVGVGSSEGDFSAEAVDGSKIVIEKRFQSGVIFDPENRPIRKFRLKEEAA